MLRAAGGGGRGITRAKQETAPRLEPERQQAERRHVEIVGLLHAGGALQAAVERVGPGMVRAAEGGAAAAALDQRRAAMAAGIDEGARHAGAIAHRDQLDVADRGGEIVAWLGDLIEPAD